MSDIEQNNGDQILSAHFTRPTAVSIDHLNASTNVSNPSGQKPSANTSNRKYGANEWDVFAALKDIAFDALKEADDEVQRRLHFIYWTHFIKFGSSGWL